MYELHPYFTNDGSIGLFSPEADDIYHSTYGALTEAFEKFIIPANLKNFLRNKSEINILDICFGIGYNSKSLISEILNFTISILQLYKIANFKFLIFSWLIKPIFACFLSFSIINIVNVNYTSNVTINLIFKIVLYIIVYLLLTVLLYKKNFKSFKI